MLVQLEVADRLAAPPGSKVYGVPSAKLAWYGPARRVGVVPRSVFWPVPNVESGLVRFQPDVPPPVSTASRAEVFAVIDAAFAQRRKMLRSALAGWAGSAAAAERMLHRGRRRPTRRSGRRIARHPAPSPTTASQWRLDFRPRHRAAAPAPLAALVRTTGR